MMVEELATALFAILVLSVSFYGALRWIVLAEPRPQSERRATDD